MGIKSYWYLSICAACLGTRWNRVVCKYDMITPVRRLALKYTVWVFNKIFIFVCCRWLPVARMINKFIGICYFLLFYIFAAIFQFFLSCADASYLVITFIRFLEPERVSTRYRQLIIWITSQSIILSLSGRFRFFLEGWWKHVFSTCFQDRKLTCLWFLRMKYLWLCWNIELFSLGKTIYVPLLLGLPCQPFGKQPAL